MRMFEIENDKMIDLERVESSYLNESSPHCYIEIVMHSGTIHCVSAIHSTIQEIRDLYKDMRKELKKITTLQRITILRLNGIKPIDLESSSEPSDDSHDESDGDDGVS